MGFGLCNETFTRAINLVHNRLNWKIALAFLDDVIVLGTSAKTHFDNLRQVLERFRQYVLKFKPWKFECFLEKVEFLCHSISSNCVENEHCEGVAYSAKCQGRRLVLGFCVLSPEVHTSFLGNCCTSVRRDRKSVFPPGVRIAAVI